MVFFELRWNYSPLKEKAVLLPDGLFVFFCREQGSLHTALHFSRRYVYFCSWDEPLGAWSASRREWSWTKFVVKLCFAPHRFYISAVAMCISAPDASRSACGRPRGV